MAEASQFERVLSLSRTAAVDIGVRPRAGWRPGRLFRSLNIWFWALVGLPTLVAGVYYFGVASDLYLSEVKFIVRGPPKAATTGAIGALLGGSGPVTSEDTFAVNQYMQSRDVVRLLEEQDHLRAVLGRQE